MVLRNRVSSGCKRFIDYKRIIIRAGDGGDGAIAFFRSSAMGPPSGGNGGKGASVYVKATKEISDLSALEKRYFGRSGNKGSSAQMHGANGKDLVLEVPIGTRIKKLPYGVPSVLEDQNDDLEIVKNHYKFANSYLPKEDRIRMLKERIQPFSAPKLWEMDLVKEGETVLVAKGGNGGFGNPHFVTPQMPGPQIAGKGDLGEGTILEIELKMIADAGMVGFPNAGKSSLLAAVSDAHPKIASYAFTTTNPYLGTIDFSDFYSITIADIPGLIKGAAQNVGMGHRFLRHIERSKILVYVIDLSSDDPVSDLKTLQNELEEYSSGLSARPSIVVGNKSDLSVSRDNYQKLIKAVEWPVIPVSAKEKKNITLLTDIMRKTLSDL
jgi:GTP-binding protein